MGSRAPVEGHEHSRDYRREAAVWAQGPPWSGAQTSTWYGSAGLRGQLAYLTD